MKIAPRFPATEVRHHAGALRAWLVPLACCALSIGLTGCQSWSVPGVTSWMKNPLAKSEPVNAPQRMAVIWSEDLMTAADGPPTRGFGGRIYFYDAQDKPMKADGQLVVFAFNDSRMQPGKERIPDRKYVFPADKLAEHFSESPIGPSYSVWLPWDQVPAAQTEISLLPVFSTKEGKLVVGAQNSNLLIARNIDGSASMENRIQVTRSTRPEGSSATASQRPSRNEAPETAQVSYDGVSAQPSRMRTLTIPMTPEMAQRLNGPPGMAPTNPGSSTGATMNSATSVNRAAAASPAMDNGAATTSAGGQTGMNAAAVRWPAPINNLPNARTTGSLRAAGSATNWDPFANPQAPLASRSALPRSPAPASPGAQ